MRRLSDRLVLWLAVSFIITSLAVPIAVFASDISDAIYSGTVRVSNDGTVATNVATNFTLSTQSLIDDHYITSNCTNTCIRTTAGADDAYMPAPGSTTAWILWVDSIAQNAYLDYTLYTGGNPMSSKIRYFPGSGGFTVSDAADLEMGDSFEVEITGWFDTTAGSNKNLVHKDSAFKLYVSASGNLTAEITGGSSVTASNINSGEHTVEVISDGSDLKIYVDSTEEDSSALGGVGVPDNANNYSFVENESMMYVEYVKMWVSE